MKRWPGWNVAHAVISLALMWWPLTVAAHFGPDWAVAIAGPCPRCVDARATKSTIPLYVPPRAIFFISQGEFARSARWNLIDLDTGNVIVLVKNLQSGEAQRTLWHLDADTLAQIRSMTIRAWHSPRQTAPPNMPPGSDIELDVIVGGKMVFLPAWGNPSDPPEVRQLMALVQQALG